MCLHIQGGLKISNKRENIYEDLHVEINKIKIKFKNIIMSLYANM